MSQEGVPWGSDGFLRAPTWQQACCRGAAVLVVVSTLLKLLMLQRRAGSSAMAYWAVTVTLALLAGALAYCQRQKRRRRAANSARAAAVILQQPQHQPKVMVHAMAKQVFDVQWSINGRDLSASRFNRPAGNGTTGRFQRADVELGSDWFQLVEAEERPGHFALQQLDSSGALKHQVTTYGQVRAISMDMLLYMGDGEYGTLILLNQEGEYGQTKNLPILMTDPPAEIVKGMVGATAGQQVPSFDPFQRDSSRNSSGGNISRGVSDAGRIVKFKKEVSQKLGKDMTLLNLDSKAELWWREDDFAEFVQVRVEIGKAYRAAARNMGVAILEVSSVGAKGAEAYQAMVQLFPELKDESRRGLGLGRKKQRARNRDDYIAAVLREQSRQCEDEEDVTSDIAEAIARAAMAVSNKDTAYAHTLASTYYEQDKMEDWDPQQTGAKDSSSSPTARLPKRDHSKSSLCSHDSGDAPGNPEEEIQALREDSEEAARTRLNTKGYGLSRDLLQASGLSATGHALSRCQRDRTSPAVRDNGESSAGESDADL